MEQATEIRCGSSRGASASANAHCARSGRVVRGGIGDRVPGPEAISPRQLWADADTVLRAQGGILLEVDGGRSYRTGADELLHFRVRNLTPSRGRLRMHVAVPRVALHQEEAQILLQPFGVHDVRFAFSSDTPGDKLVEALTLDLEFGEQRRRLVLPDHAVWFAVAAPAEIKGGRIDLCGANFDFKEHVGDVVIRDLLRKQDRQNPSLDEEDWRALVLVPRAKTIRHVRRPRPDLPVTARKVCPAEPRDAVLLGPPDRSGRERRIFLFARDDLAFGATSWHQDSEVPLLLSRFDRPLDHVFRTNRKLNDYVSRLHGRIALRAGRLMIRDENSTNGTALDGRRIERGVWTELPNHFQLNLTALRSVLHVAGHTCYALPSHADVEASDATAIDALRLDRLGNGPSHTYAQVFRAATIGSSSDCAVRIDGESVAPRHAELTYRRGTWFIRALDAKGRTRIDGRPLPADRAVALHVGTELMVGDTTLRFEAADPEQMLRP